MRVTLINPAQTFPTGSLKTVEQLPLGLLYIAGALRASNHNVSIIDALRKNDQLTTNDCGARYGMSTSEILDELQSLCPAIVGISNPFSFQIQNTIELARAIKHAMPNCIIVVGGAEATLNPIRLMREVKEIDFCVQGEGEKSFVALVNSLYFASNCWEKIAGISFRVNDVIVQNPPAKLIENLDELPYPAYDLLDMETYLSNPYKLMPRIPKTTRVVEMITSRGCPFECVFCSVHSMMGKKFRAHSSEYVLDHIEHLIINFQVEHIRFNDDNFSMNVKRFERILDGIIERNLKFTWDCPNGIRADQLSDQLIQKMKQAGCVHIFVAAESGSQRILDDVIGKKIKLVEIEQTLKMAQKHNLDADVYFIMGLPGETKETLNQTYQKGIYFQKKYRANPYYFVAMPLPGTKLQEICIEKGYLKRSHKLMSATSGKAIIATEDFSLNDVDEMLHKATKRSTQIRKMQNVLLLFSSPKKFITKLKYRLAA